MVPTSCRASRVDASRDLLVGELGAQLDGVALDGAVREHRHREHDPRRQADELHAADRRLLDRRPDDDGRVVGEASEQEARVAQHLLERAVRVREERAHLLRSGRVERSGARQGVDEEPVALVGGDAAGARVRLLQVAVDLERGHLVAHRRRGDVDRGRRGHVVRPDRLRGADVLLHDGLEDRRLSLVQHARQRSRRHSRVITTSRMLPRYPEGPTALCVQTLSSSADRRLW